MEMELSIPTDISTKNEAKDFIANLIESLVKNKPEIIISILYDNLTDYQRLLAENMDKLNKKIKLFNYTPTNDETNKQISMYLIMNACDKVKKLLPQIFAKANNKQFSEDYNKCKL